MGELNLLTVKQLAGLLNVTPWWIYQEVRSNRLPSIRIGRRQLRFNREEILKHYGLVPSSKEAERGSTV